MKRRVMCEKCRVRRLRQTIDRSPMLRGPAGTNDALLSGRNLLRVQLPEGCFEVMPDGRWVRL